MSDPKPFPWRTAFLASLGINLLVIGGVAGAFGSGARLERPAAQVQTPPPAQQQADVPLEQMPAPRAFLAAAPPEARQTIRRDLSQTWRETRNERVTARDARAELYEAATADTYDAARVKRAFAHLREANQNALAPFQNRLADSFGGMSAAERRAAIDTVLTRPAATDAPALAPGPRLRDLPREERRELLRERLRERREQRFGN
jgi:uncharacterized membrane protein